MRALESAAEGRRQLRAGAARTRLYITPGYPFRVVDALLTNFHMPRSSLLILVAAFAGLEARARNLAPKRGMLIGCRAYRADSPSLSGVLNVNASRTATDGGSPRSRDSSHSRCAAERPVIPPPTTTNRNVVDFMRRASPSSRGRSLLLHRPRNRAR